MKKGEKDIYKMTKSRKWKTRDTIQVKYIKNETGRLLTKGKDQEQTGSSLKYGEVET
jgi:hypothetical protein